MKKRATILLMAAACALLLTLTATVAPKAVKAAVATLVQNVDQPARHVFSGQCEAAPGGDSCTFQVPAGVEYVIQNLTYQASAGGSGAIALSTKAGGNIMVRGYPVVPATAGYCNYWTTPVTAYADQSTTITIFFPNHSTSPCVNFAIIEGYHVTNP
jgi:hypothetical protein